MVLQSSCGLANNYYHRGVNMLMAPFRSASGVSGMPSGDAEIPLADPTRAGEGLDTRV